MVAATCRSRPDAWGRRHPNAHCTSGPPVAHGGVPRPCLDARRSRGRPAPKGAAWSCHGSDQRPRGGIRGSAEHGARLLGSLVHFGAAFACAHTAVVPRCEGHCLFPRGRSAHSVHGSGGSVSSGSTTRTLRGRLGLLLLFAGRTSAAAARRTREVERCAGRGHAVDHVPVTSVGAAERLGRGETRPMPRAAVPRRV